ncbi:MAG: hypothetical protein IPF92_26675 [Myxococcales bacterium]|nr:hypothetical protein [Myxococcales bacterium]
MIGRSLSDRHGRGRLADADAIAIVRDALPTQAENLVGVRAEGAEMIAFLVVRADDAAVRVGKALGLELAKGSTVTFGLAGADAERLLGATVALRPAQRAWLAAPCAPRETKVLLLCGGLALVSLVIRDGRVVISTA